MRMEIEHTTEPRLAGPLIIMEFDATTTVAEAVAEWLDETVDAFQFERVSTPAGRLRTPHEILTRIMGGVHRYRLSMTRVAFAVQFRLRWSDALSEFEVVSAP